MINCLMQEDRKWHLWPSCIKHICQKLVQEGRKWHLQPSCIKHICQILVQYGRKWHFLNTFCLIFWKIKGLRILKIVQNVLMYKHIFWYSIKNSISPKMSPTTFLHSADELWLENAWVTLKKKTHKQTRSLLLLRPLCLFCSKSHILCFSFHVKANSETQGYSNIIL